MLKLIMAASVALTLTGCSSTKTVYPNDCAIVSNIPVEKADPKWLEDPIQPEKFTDAQIKNGATNAEVLSVITKNNSELWQKDRDIRRQWKEYYERLVAKGIIK